jgi:hypothetical protein
MVNTFTESWLKQSYSVEWYTPAYIFEALKVEFDLDPCSPPTNIYKTPAKNHYTLPTDGLNENWFGCVWLNPPYGKGVDQWLIKLANHNNGIALVNINTLTTKYYQQLKKPKAICLVKKRINFVNPIEKTTSTGLVGSVLLAYGEIPAFAVTMSELGQSWIN